MLVSIIVANYNKAAYVAQMLESVCCQTLGNWELIIVDDVSEDDSIAVIEKYLKDIRIKLLKNEKRAGANYSRNKGIQAAHGEYLIFLDADDVLLPFCIEQRLSTAKLFPDLNLLVFSMGVFTSVIGDKAGVWIPISKNPLKDFLRHHLPWSILQPLWKREFLLELGGFDETFKRLQDVELSTRALLSESIRYKLLPGRPDCYYRIDENRKNFHTLEFLNRWVDSAVRYCDNFMSQVGGSLPASLNGTIYHTYLQLLYYYKLKKISANEFNELETHLFKYRLYENCGQFRRILFRMAKWYHLKLPRIPGINFAISRLIS